MSASAPPGWYDTGVPGEQGWWDGLAWTPHRRPAAAVPPPPAPVTPVAVPAAGTAPASATPAVTAAPAPAPGGVPSTWAGGTRW
ncbi:MAG: DUF2510 domain-containing protein [Microbacterium sp.]|uniref:DUF2510 domain-containing protein n=1 Tax=Microbacterium sp. TaxID=51671 RepID=UPI002614E9F9|nr:DUF2510 domain-containing protein [Microbacterium sp.]MCX6502407.1 DUF2510 domain-containing protein [Microbacterium sp.]